MLRSWVPTDRSCPECGSTRTVLYRSTEAVYCGDCGRDYLPANQKR
jgi:ribosomal protein S27E